MRRLYSTTAVQKLMVQALEYNYDIRQFMPESLGVGGVALVATNDDWDNVIIEERYINEWSSGHTVRRCRKISARIQKLIEKYEEENL